MRKIVLIFVLASSLFGGEIFATFDVVPVKSAKLAMQSSGIVASVSANVGDMVKKGDVLARLDSSSEEIALELAKTAFAFAVSSFEKVKSAKSVSSKQSFDEARLRLDEARLNVKKIEDMIDKKSLKAPFDAIIADKFIEVGDGVAQVAQPLFLIQSYPKNKLLIGIGSAHMGLVKIGDEFKFIQHGKPKSVQITAIHPNINPKNQKFYVEAICDGLTVGEFGEGSVVVK